MKRELPARLKNAIRLREVEEGLYPKAGNDAVRHLVQAEKEGYDLEHPSFTEWWKRAHQWIREQRKWQKRAHKAQAEIARRFPPPPHETIIKSGSVHIPAFMRQSWYETLVRDWSEALPEAVVAAERWLDEQPT